MITHSLNGALVKWTRLFPIPALKDVNHRLANLLLISCFSVVAVVLHCLASWLASFDDSLVVTGKPIDVTIVEAMRNDEAIHYGYAFSRWTCATIVFIFGSIGKVIDQQGSDAVQLVPML